MTAVIICCHGALAAGFESALHMMLGSTPLVIALPFNEGEGLMDLHQKICAAVTDAGCGNALVFTDLFGASPANASAAALFDLPVPAAVITGANAAMILEAAVARSQYEDVEALAAYLADTGRGNIRVITKETVLKAGENT